MIAPFGHYTSAYTVTPQAQPNVQGSPSPQATPQAVIPAARESLNISTSSDLQLKRKPLINLSPEVTGGVHWGGLSADAVAGVATIGL